MPERLLPVTRKLPGLHGVLVQVSLRLKKYLVYVPLRPHSFKEILCVSTLPIVMYSPAWGMHGSVPVNWSLALTKSQALLVSGSRSASATSNESVFISQLLPQRGGNPTADLIGAVLRGMIDSSLCAGRWGSSA